MAGKKSPKACGLTHTNTTRERVARVADYAVGVLRERGATVRVGSLVETVATADTRRKAQLLNTANTVETLTAIAGNVSQAFADNGVVVLSNAQHNTHARYFVAVRRVAGVWAFVVVTVSSVDGHDGLAGVITLHRSVVFPKGGVFRVRDAGIRIPRACACGGETTPKAFDARYLDDISKRGGVVSDTIGGAWLAGEVMACLNDPLDTTDLKPAKAESAHNFLVATWSHGEVESWNRPQDDLARIGHRI